MAKTKNNKIIIDDYEKEIENSLAKGKWSSTYNWKKRKNEIQKAVRNVLELRKTKRVTFRIAQIDLIKLKTRAVEKRIPYQTLLTALIRDYVEGDYSVKI